MSLFLYVKYNKATKKRKEKTILIKVCGSFCFPKHWFWNVIHNKYEELRFIALAKSIY